MPLSEITRASTLGQRAAQMLRNAIVCEEISAGEHLVEEKTALELGVSRGPLREALRQLEHEGLVHGGRRGYVVAGISDNDIEEIFSLRQAFEQLAVARALERAGPADEDRLRDLVRHMEEAATSGDGLSFAALDNEFHSHFYKVAQHRRLATAWEELAPSVTLLLEVSNTTDRDLKVAARGHESLLAAFVARDPTALQQEVRHHLEHSAELVAHARRVRLGKL